VNAGSGAERVVDVPVVVPVEVLVELVCVGVLWVVPGVAVELVGVSGALETVTVFVPPPHAASSVAAPASSAATLARSAFDLVLEPVPCILRMVFATRLGPPRLVSASPEITPQPRASCATGESSRPEGRHKNNY
jgi:hypothetical protein